MDKFDSQVSVILPTYNRANMVGRAVKSVLGQSYDNLELIVVDDASSDHTKKVIQEFDDNRLKYIRHDENQGQAAAENTGIGRSTGEYIAFIDDDVEWLPSKVKNQVDAMNNAPESVGAVHCGYYNQFNGYLREGNISTIEGNIYRDLLLKNISITTSKLLIKRQCLEECGTWDESLPGFIDYDLCLRIAKEYEFIVVPKPLVVSHSHSQPRISTGWKSSWKNMDAIIEKWGDEMKAQIGPHGVEQYKEQTLEWIYWQAAMENAKQHNKKAALSKFLEYIRLAGYNNPKRIPFFLFAILGGHRSTSYIKRIWFRVTGKPRDQVIT